MQRLKKTIKRMAAIGTSIAMFGATITGAVAQDLAKYPQPYVDESGVFNEDTAIVIGANAQPIDTLGAIDIAQQLQFDAKTPVSGGGGDLSVAGGVTEDIPLGETLSNDTTIGFDWNLDSKDIESLQDTSVSFQGKNYDAKDILVPINKGSGGSPSIETSLSSSDDDYESNVFLEVERASIRYYYHFDDTINVTKTKATDSLEIKFLGKNLEITKVDSPTKFTAFVGSEFFMEVGDSVTVDGKKVTLVNVGEGGAVLVDVDGVLDTVPSSSTKTINGIEISNDETFFTNEKSERAATLIIGETAQDTYADGDAYVGEDEDDPDWVWNVGNLQLNAATGLVNSTSDPGGPFIGIENDFVKNDDSDDPAGVGECYDLPNNYASICFDSLTVSDEDYLPITIEFATGVDTGKSRHPNATSSANVIQIRAPGEDRFVIKTADPSGAINLNRWSQVNSSNTVTNAKTNTIYLQSAVGVQNESGAPGYGNATMLFFRDPDQTPTTVYGGIVDGVGDGGRNLTIVTFAQLDFGTSEANNLQFMLERTIDGAQHKIRLNFSGDSSTELKGDENALVINFSLSSNVYNALGATRSTEEANEVVWYSGVPLGRSTGGTGIGTRDEDHRGLYGEIIKDPKSNGASDQVVVHVPSDQVQTNIVVKGATTRVTGGAVSYIPADIDVKTFLDNEVSGSESDYDLILVGGPCANKAVEAVSDLGIVCSGWNLAPGEALIKFASNGDNVALLVAGTNGMDTRLAAKVLSNYKDYTAKLTGRNVKVTGTVSNPVITSA